ncbi:hypothetical protein K435DRAFT_839781 [Dendrothele bispora CBS 962.96]|uniref:Uncharacterized protein n=1 Tax=Dendrothele bispora (strain CBS 962.96) TaxID=1314807 RepID=A0A4S8LY89_DENBC|nr:hypothetical protein K435DRAFT_839781 [Dendrothele bispora CBS 962.96]
MASRTRSKVSQCITNENNQPAVKSKATKKPATLEGKLKKVGSRNAGKGAKAGLLGNTINVERKVLLAATAQPQLQGPQVSDDDEDNETTDDDTERDIAAMDVVERSPAVHVGDVAAMDIEKEEPETGSTPDPVTDVNEVAELRAQLAELLQKNKSLEQQLQAAPPSANVDSIPRPTGTAGKDFSIQVAMNLAGSVSKDGKYKALQRCVKDLVGHARVPYDIPWKQVPVQTKSLLYEAARQDQPFLRRYQNDWATEEIAKQYLKNKRKTAYKNGWLKVSDKYTHLKQNSACRSVSGSRSSKAKGIRESREARKASKKARKSSAPTASDDMAV